MDQISIIKRYPIDGEPIVLSSLNSRDREAVCHYYNDDGQALLKKLYESQHWLQCGCKYKNPTSVKFIKGACRYVLARLPYRTKHEQGCTFFKIDTNKYKEKTLPAVKRQDTCMATSDSYSFSYRYDYRKALQSKMDENQMVRVDDSDEFVQFITSLTNPLPAKIWVPDAYDSKREMYIRSAPYLFDKQGVSKVLVNGFFSDYKDAKRSIEHEIRTSPKALPTRLVLGTVNDIEVSDNGVKLATYVPKHNNGPNRYEYLSRYTPITHIHDLHSGPYMCAAVLGKIGKDHRTGAPKIGLLHLFVYPLVTFNSYIPAPTKLLRTLLKVMYTLANSSLKDARKITLRRVDTEPDSVTALFEFDMKAFAVTFTETSEVDCNSNVFGHYVVKPSILATSNSIKDVFASVITDMISDTKVAIFPFRNLNER